MHTRGPPEGKKQKKEAFMNTTNITLGGPAQATRKLSLQNYSGRVGYKEMASGNLLHVRVCAQQNRQRDVSVGTFMLFDIFYFL